MFFEQGEFYETDTNVAWKTLEDWKFLAFIVRDMNQSVNLSGTTRKKFATNKNIYIYIYRIFKNHCNY